MVYSRGMNSAALDVPNTALTAPAPAAPERGEMIASAMRQPQEKVAVASVDWFLKARDLKERLEGALRWVDLKRDDLKKELAQEFDTYGFSDILLNAVAAGATGQGVAATYTFAGRKAGLIGTTVWALGTAVGSYTWRRHPRVRKTLTASFAGSIGALSAAEGFMWMGGLKDGAAE